MTTAHPDVDVADITHLDFAPPCDSKNCDREAAWVLTWKLPEPPCCPPPALICSPHLNVFLQWRKADLYVGCTHRVVGRIRDVLSRIEPL